MKVIRWVDTGASLLDPVPAHLITPKYEHVAKRRWRLSSNDRSGAETCRQATESANTLGQDCGRRVRTEQKFVAKAAAPGAGV